MSDHMPWRSATSRLSALKSYLPEIKRTLSPKSLSIPGPAGWRGRIKRGWSGDSTNVGEERVALFPGWAARRYRKSEGGHLAEAFEVEVYVSGYVSSHRTLESATRSQRAFIRLAKGFASLPKLNEVDIPTLTPSTEKLLESVKLPARPSEMTEDDELEALELEFRAAQEQSPPSSLGVTVESPDSASPADDPVVSSPQDISFPFPAQVNARNVPSPLSAASLVKRMHMNLESRLSPFWSTPLSARIIRISLFASLKDASEDDDNAGFGPITMQETLTESDGSFHTRLVVRWEDICQHPSGVSIAFGDPSHEHDLLISASLLPTPVSTPTSAVSVTRPISPIRSTTVWIPLTHSPVRLISDIDDTVKLSNVLDGARAVFRNVFVRDLKDNVIHGMGEWYMDMWRRGVRFHYVSNGPFELLPVINEFFQVSGLPRGSLRLRSYAGRSLFNGLLSAPAARKRDGVLSVLNSFPESRFLLVGDTGEQDLELYSAIASERPEQVLGVFVRDAGTWETGIGAVDDPTGVMWASVLGWAAAPLSKRNSYQVGPTAPSTSPTRSAVLRDIRLASSLERDAPPASFFTPNPPPSYQASVGGLLPPSAEPAFYLESASRFETPPNLNEPDIVAALNVNGEQWLRRQGFTDVEKKRAELQVRVWKAKAIMPEHIPLRVFRHPDDCKEVEDILEKLHVCWS